MKPQIIKEFSILLVEDDSVANYLATHKLNHFGIENVSCVENGLDALTYIENNTCPDIIFLDINMPIMDGFEFLAEKEANNMCPDSKVVIVTSSLRPCDREKSNEFTSVVDFLEKPLSYPKIEDILLKISLNRVA